MRDKNIGVITTVVGTGEKGHDGDGGPATAARLDLPFTVAFDRSGNLLVAEAGANSVRRVDTAGRISTVYGPTGARPEDVAAVAAGFESGPKERFAVVERLSRKVRFFPGPTVEDARFRDPHDVIRFAKNSVLVADVAASQVHEIDVESGAILRTLGTGRKAREGDGGPVEKASFQGSRALARDPRDGTLYVIEREGHRIRRVDPKGVITTLAGLGKPGYEGDGGPASAASFRGPKGACVDPKSGDLYVVDTENHAVRRIDAKTGVITTVAGGRKGAAGDGGPATAAGLDRPHGIALSPDGARLYIADSENHRVRRVVLR
ncbi:MAG TPA: hypothetical protein VM490_08410 [Armatimonadaceae bacterium]|nr:hypothetical protein [Armatimonadaceae bacterium]